MIKKDYPTTIRGDYPIIIRRDCPTMMGINSNVMQNEK